MQINSASQEKRVWFITGCSTGLGLALARRVLASGERAAVTARDAARLAPLFAEFGELVLPLALDLTDPVQIDAAAKAALAHFGHVDVLVNNAGYGYLASIEEGDDAEIRAQFDANVFGLFAMTRALLPRMRERRRGHVINITSTNGFLAFAGTGYYAASKHAVEGWADALAIEGKPIGIKVSCIAPGPFRTDWAGRSLKHTPTQIAEYEETAGARTKGTLAKSGHQLGDPDRAAQLMMTVADMDEPPLHVVLGALGINAVTRKLRRSLDEIEQWRDAGLATDFPESNSIPLST